MFDKLAKYKNSGSFYFERGQSLRSLSRDVPELPGVYVISTQVPRGEKVVYVGKSGSMLKDGTFGDQRLRGRINNKHNSNETRQFYFSRKLLEDSNIICLKISWYVTFDENNQEIPAFVEAQLLQSFFANTGRLPEWNEKF